MKALLFSSLVSLLLPLLSSSPQIAPFPFANRPLARSNQLPFTCKVADKSAYSCDLTQVDNCCTHKLGLLVLAQQWVVGFGPAEHFTLHGLWPDFCDGTWGPTGGCDATRLYDDVSRYLPGTLIEQMNTVWPSYRGNNTKFWTYEWGKHGTCVSTLEPRCFPPLNYFRGMEVVPYFQSAIRLNRRYNIYAALKKAGIVPKGLKRFPLEPSNLIPLASVERAIKDAFGVRAQINCTAGVINEIMIYFKSQGREAYVPVSTNDPHGCPEMVLFPLKYENGETGPKLWDMDAVPKAKPVASPKAATEIIKNTPNPASPPAKPPPRPKTAAIPSKSNKNTASSAAVIAAKKASPPPSSAASNRSSPSPAKSSGKGLMPPSKPQQGQVEPEPEMEISVSVHQ